ncbi:hypothetical protein ANN_17347 [Periplaneta americana]|uniref:Uncharacterized protein n=1 Tax=Periplaneta americana TaxID=6978 RepID=A0ABQ8SU33_PERAM|nr:hypothetical protein ANN_17347 [Periplaneta americana]
MFDILRFLPTNASCIVFSMRIIKKSNRRSKELAYKTLVRSIMEYGVVGWDPYRQNQIDSIEKIQRRAAKYVKMGKGHGEEIVKDLDRLFNDAISTTRLFSVDEIGDSEMRPRIRHRLPGIYRTVGENLGKKPTSSIKVSKRVLKSDMEEIPVCLKAFISLHEISCKLVQVLQNSLKSTGMPPKDQRGKHHNHHNKKSDNVFESVLNHIKSLWMFRYIGIKNKDLINDDVTTLMERVQEKKEKLKDILYTAGSSRIRISQLLSSDVMWISEEMDGNRSILMEPAMHTTENEINGTSCPVIICHQIQCFWLHYSAGTQVLTEMSIRSIPCREGLEDWVTIVALRHSSDTLLIPIFHARVIVLVGEGFVFSVCCM